MQLETYALIAEIVGAFTIVVSLLYVGYQVRINTAEKRVDSVQSITSGYRQLALVYVNNEEAGIAWHRILDGEELTKRQVDLMSDCAYSHLMALEETYNKHQEGYLDDDFLNARVSLMRSLLLLSPQLREVYEAMKRHGIYAQSFVEWLETELQKSVLYDEPRRLKSLSDLN